MKIIIVGGGVGGLTLSLLLHKAGIDCQVFEAAPKIEPIGLGINLLPHCTRVLDDVGLTANFEAKAVVTREAVFFNRFGQLIYSEPAGKFAGYKYPQFSVHRADLHQILIDACQARLGPGNLVLGHRFLGAEQSGGKVTATFEDTVTGARLPAHEADIVVGADGLHSVMRKQLHPDESKPIYSGVNMWRGATIAKPFLTGASMARIGWLTSGKFVVYPVRDNVDGKGNQLINWVAELEIEEREASPGWDKKGLIAEFLPAFENWKFDWIDVPDLIHRSEHILEYPMVDQEALPFWSRGGVTLLGDAAHPMYPRGSNGAAQAILDADYLAACLVSEDNGEQALKAYEAQRLPTTREIVLTNRQNPPDSIIREVFERTGDQPFDRIEDVISRDEMKAIGDNYRKVAGFTAEHLNK